MPLALSFPLAWSVLLDGGLTLAIGVTVAMLIVAVFSQPGQIKLSPQRESALATGHTDRKTVFENTLLRRPLWILLVLSHRVAIPTAKNWIRRQLVAIGNPNYYTPEEYLSLGLLMGVVFALALQLLHFLVYAQFSIMAAVAGLVAGIALTIFQLYNAASKRTRQISKRVPYALDLIALAMGAGATFTEAVTTIVREKVDDPFNAELRTLLAEMELGTTRRTALLNLSNRVPLEELRTIIASVVQAEELGTPLGNVLHDQATLLRLRRSVSAENVAARASVRILVPCLLLVMAVILTVFGPVVLKVIRGGLF